MLEIFLIIAVAITIVLVRKQEQKTKSYMMTPDPFESWLYIKIV